MSAVIALSVYLVLVMVERPFLEGLVQPYPGTTVNAWIDDFVIAGVWGLWVCVGAVTIWYILSALVFKVVHWRSGAKRTWWAALGLTALFVPLGVAFIMTERTVAGGEWAWVFYLLNPVVLFYLTTSLFSPDSFKYVPWGAREIRYWW